MTDLFVSTQRPDTALLFHRNDPNDPRLGEVIPFARDAYEKAGVVILGCPQDEGVRRNGGRLGAAIAPDEIRRCFYKLTTTGLESLLIFDLGNTIIQDTLEDTHSLHQQIVRQVIEDGKTLVVLGGGNDISYPDCSGLAQAANSIMAFNIDAHYDVRADEVRNSGTPYRQLLEEGYVSPSLFYEIGSQPFANSPIYTQYLHEKGAHVHMLPALRRTGLESTLKSILNQRLADAIFWGVDMDSVRAADAPGVSAPNPTGLSGDELCLIAQMAGNDPRTRLFEISEVNPNFDIDGRTCRLAAAAIHILLSALASRIDLHGS